MFDDPPAFRELIPTSYIIGNQSGLVDRHLHLYISLLPRRLLKRPNHFDCERHKSEYEEDNASPTLWKIDERCASFRSTCYRFLSARCHTDIEYHKRYIWRASNINSRYGSRFFVLSVSSSLWTSSIVQYIYIRNGGWPGCCLQDKVRSYAP